MTKTATLFSRQHCIYTSLLFEDVAVVSSGAHVVWLALTRCGSSIWNSNIARCPQGFQMFEDSFHTDITSDFIKVFHYLVPLQSYWLLLPSPQATETARKPSSRFERIAQLQLTLLMGDVYCVCSPPNSPSTGVRAAVQGWSYFLGRRFCVLCFEICISSLFSPSPLCSAKFKTKHTLNLWPNK